MGASEGARALAERLRAASADVAELVRSLLVLSRDHAAAAREAERSDAIFAATLPWVERAASSLRAAPFELGAEVRGDAAAALEALARLGDGHAALGARRLALALDASPHGELLVDRLLVRGERALDEDDLVPFLSPLGQRDHPLRRAYEGRLGTSPARLGVDAASLPRSARLAPHMPHGARLVFAPGYGAALDGLGEATRVACALPSSRAALELPPVERRRGAPRFFGVAPREPREQRRRARELLARADALGASVVLLPEVSVDEGGARALAKWTLERARSVRLTVCGSFHALRRGERRNVCLIAARGAGTRELCKLVPFVTRVGDEDALEDIAPSAPEVVLLAGTRASALVLVCRDFVDRELARAAEDLRPTLVLVPACSPRTTDFAATAAKLASGAQAHVLVANLCDEAPGERPAVALLARPERLEVQPLVVERGSVAPPALIVGGLTSGGLSAEGSS